MMVNRRGEGLSLNFIIVAILALITLIVIALFFTGGITKLFGTEKEISRVSLDPQIRSLAETTCNFHCTNQNENAYNNPSFPKDLVESGFTGCEQLLGKPFSSCRVEKSCQKADPASAVTGCVGTTEASCVGVTGCVWK